MATKTPRFKVAAAHAAPVYMDKAASIKKTISLIEQAAQDDIKLLIFPEVFIPGYPFWAFCYPGLQQIGALAKFTEESVVVEENGEDMIGIQAACRKTGVAISLGISERMAGGYSIFNSQVMIDNDGSILGVHRKLQPTLCERSVWAQGNGSTLRTWPLSLGYNIGGLCCSEHMMNGARQALFAQNEHIHAGAWPALSAMAGQEIMADVQMEAIMKAHAVSGQVFTITASTFVDEAALQWMKNNLGEQQLIKEGGGWSSIVDPMGMYLVGPHTGANEKLVQAEIDLSMLGFAKVLVDAAGHYSRPEILQFEFDEKPYWADEKKRRFGIQRTDKKTKEEVEECHE